MSLRFSDKLLDFFRKNHDGLFKISIFVIVVYIVVLFLPKEQKFKYNFQKNKPWVHEDLFAPFDFAINKTDEEIGAEQSFVKSNQLLYFDVDNRVKESVIESYLTWVAKNIGQKSSSNATNEKISVKGVEYLGKIYEKGVIEIVDEIEGNEKNYRILLMGEDKVGEEMELGDLYTISSAYTFIKEDLDNSSVKNMDVILRGIENSIKHNVKFNESLTNKDLDYELEAISLAKGGVFEKEKIISKGELVTEEKYTVLNSLKEEYESKVGRSNQPDWIILGQVLIVSLLFLGIYFFLKNVRPDVFDNNMDIGFIVLLVISFFALTLLVIKINEANVYIIPYTIIPLLVRAFFGNRLALFIYTISIYLISLIVPNPLEFILLESITGIIVLFMVMRVDKRAELFYTSVLIFVTLSVLYTGFSLLREGDLEAITINMFGWFTLAAAFTLITYPLIYIFERIFGYISDVSLLELSNTNNKLLRELNLKAPGTFQHSLQVSNLAEEAIQEIGGNPMLVRAGALYHDIGKMSTPAYFIENQTSGINPHDELGYEESAGIIIGHVIKGIELAKKNKLPEQIIDFIRTHHGTTKTQYFLRMSRKEDIDNSVKEEVFQYPGPKPYSKETAVLMMADSVEAASRSLKKYDEETIKDLVSNIIDSQISEDQFSNTDITFNDISIIKRLFAKKLANIYHVRMDYPD